MKEELEGLRKKVKEQARQIRIMQESLEIKNRNLDALHWVWCSGGCEGGIHRWTSMPSNAEMEDIVRRATINTKRLQIWWRVYKWRIPQKLKYRVLAVFEKLWKIK